MNEGNAFVDDKRKVFERKILAGILNIPHFVSHTELIEADFGSEANRVVFRAAVKAEMEDKPFRGTDAVDAVNAAHLDAESYADYLMREVNMETSADADSAAEKLHKLGQHTRFCDAVSELYYKDCIDTGRGVENMAADLIALCQGWITTKETDNSPGTRSERLYNSFFNPDPKTAFFDTGIPAVNKLIPMRRGDYIALSGAPGAGKTAFVNQITRKMAEDGHPVLFVSLDMDGDTFEVRDWARHTGISERRMQDVRAGRADLEPSEKRLLVQTACYHTDLPFTTIDRQTIVGSPQEIEREVLRYSPEVLVLDYIQISTSESSRDTELQRVTAMSQKLRELSVRKKMLVIGLSQFNNSGLTNKRHGMTDLLNGGQIVRDADAVVDLWVEDKEIIGLSPIKSRSGGVGDTVYLKFTGATYSFTEAANADGTPYTPGSSGGDWLD